MEPSPFSPDASLGTLLAAEAFAAAPAGLAPRARRGVERPVFVVGCPRSGTTVLGACLAAHSHLAGGQESLFVLDLWRVFIDLHQGHNQQRWAPLAEYLPAGELLESLGALADNLFAGLQRARGKPRCVDHTPWYVALVPFLDLLYPDAAFVHLVRDGREVVRSLSASFAKGFAWAGASVGERARLWARLVTAGARAGAALPAGRYQQVRYEDLCADPRAVLSGLLGALGLSWEEEVLVPLATPHARPSRPDAALGRLEGGRDLRLTARPAETRWPEGWGRQERLDFAREGDAVLRQLGYPVLPCHD
jgi:hypothetical protein